MAAARDATIQVSLRTYRIPSATSRQSAVCCSSFRPSGRVRIAKMHPAETANVAASAMNAHPAPGVTNRPPSMGPITIIASGRTTWPIEFASTSRSSGTSKGTNDEKAGLNIA